MNKPECVSKCCWMIWVVRECKSYIMFWHTKIDRNYVCSHTHIHTYIHKVVVVGGQKVNSHHIEKRAHTPVFNILYSLFMGSPNTVWGEVDKWHLASENSISIWFYMTDYAYFSDSPMTAMQPKYISPWPERFYLFTDFIKALTYPFYWQRSL